MTAAEPRLFTIPAGLPFLRVLARAVLAGGFPHEGIAEPDPVALSRFTILVPTRRAARALAEAFLDASDGQALLLPRIRPIADVDEIELMAEGLGPSDTELALPPAISGLERRLLLAREIMARPAGSGAHVVTAAQALALAGELGALIDSFETEEVDFGRVASLVADEFAGHWAQTLDFLEVVTRRLPEIMAGRGLMGPAARRNRLIDAEAARLAAGPVDGPVIAAGSTGSIPATGRLLAAVARLADGAVVLPGLDLDLDEETWQSLTAPEAPEPGHPQYGMKLLLDAIGAPRDIVRPMAGETARPASRTRLLGEALRPAETTDRWAGADAGQAGADEIEGLTVVEAPSPREEAAVVALILRRALETPGRTAALVTPDRGLARRVSAELDRWGVEADDSAGHPLRLTPAGTLMMAILEAVEDGLAPVPLLTLLKHPLAAFGGERGEARGLARSLEIAALRGVRPGPGIEGLRAALAAGGPAPGLGAYVDRVEHALGPLLDLFQQPGEMGLAPLVSAHAAAAEAVSDDGSGGAAALWSGDAGESLAGFLGELMENAAGAPALGPRDYTSVLSTLLDGVVVRPRAHRHPRIAILGLLEARLLDADVMVLGGLNEGVWPPTTTVDAWLNRPMRAELGLQPPERRIGLTAHDFVQAACSPEVYLTRARKADNAPTVPSRWLLRLDALLEGMGLKDRIRPGGGEPWLAWAQGLDDHGGPARPVPMPRPAPPVEIRPRRLSVTRVEDWIRDPYAIFARYVLGLVPLDPIDADPGAAERGTMVHEAMSRFLEEVAGQIGPDALARLIAIGEEVFSLHMDRPSVAAFWWPRFRRAAAWFVEQEAALRDGVTRQVSEVVGATTIDGPAGPFELGARADRIDLMADGTLRICDYKTGRPPSVKQVEAGLSPQLSLEAVIAANGGFEGLDAADVSALVYLGLSGGDPPGELREIPEPATRAAEALDGLRRRITAFDDPATAYLPRRVAEFERWAYDYDRLARHAEWSLQAARGEGP
jgi:ATP-dependent helicase/nuclease subunit B